MIESGDYLVPRFQDEVRSKKPAGIYWLQAGSVTLLSDAASAEIWPYRLPSVLGAWIAVLLTHAIGVLLLGRRAGFVAAALLAAAILVVTEAHIAKADAVLLATVMLAQWGVARLVHAGPRSLGAIQIAPLAVWGGLGVAVLIKGPVGLAIVLLTVLALRFAGGQRHIVRGLMSWRGFLLFMIVVAPWPLALHYAGEGGFIGRAVGEDLLPKLFSGQESHGAPPGTYMVLSTLLLWPVSIVLVPAALYAWRRRSDPGVAFILAWLLPSWLMFELVPTKLAHYILPLVPAIALLAAGALFDSDPWIDRGWARRFVRAHVGLWILVCVAISGALLWLPFDFTESTPWLGLPAAILILVGAVTIGRWAWLGRMQAAAAGAVVLAVFLYPTLGVAYAPWLDRIWPSRTIAALLKSEEGPPRLAAAGFHEPSLVFFTGTDTKLTTVPGLAAHLAAKPGAHLLVPAEKLAELEALIADRGLGVEAMARIRAFNYSKGDPLDLVLLRDLRKTP